MIDHAFYRKTEEDGIRTMFDGSRKPDEVFNMVMENRSPLASIDQIETTNACNMKCVMCPRGKPNLMTRKVQAMGTELFHSLVDQIADTEREKDARDEGRATFLRDPPPSLVWPGSAYDVTGLRLHHFGSPTLDPKLLERVGYIKEHASFPVQFSDTIVNMQLDTARELFRLQLDRLIVCLDGTTAEDFERVRGVRVHSFDTMIQRMHDIVEAKSVLGTETKLDVQLIQMANAPEVSFVQDWGAVPGVHVHIKPFFPYPDVPHDLVTEGDTVFQHDCRIPLTSLTILSDGRVVPCNADYNGEHILGDTREQTLQQIWESERVIDFCRRFIHDLFERTNLCHRCGFYPYSSIGNTPLG
ncbi:MAG: SPASM domain-containing protein [Candidatus Peribacteraceae bacterium]|nr:SPASM domain-containing protein [Candidatus Peribacteraceae bacterium]MDD5739308.1 SPASM domain-containing protein [Candidatus Peribacteraceae bacterium]